MLFYSLSKRDRLASLPIINNPKLKLPNLREKFRQRSNLVQSDTYNITSIDASATGTGTRIGIEKQPPEADRRAQKKQQLTEAEQLRYAEEMVRQQPAETERIKRLQLEVEKKQKQQLAYAERMRRLQQEEEIGRAHV